MFYIYKVTNLTNKKVYIGKTCRDISIRWNEHCSSAFNKEDNFYFHNAIRKYGKDSFLVEKIDTTNSIDELNYLEKKYIKEFKSNKKEYGYNLTIGGDGNQKYNWAEIQQMWDTGYCVKDIIKILNCDKSVVSQALKNYKDYSYSKSLQRSNANSRPIKQFNDKKELIKVFPSIAAAAREIDCNETTIRNCLKNKTYSTMGFFWCYENEELPKNIKIINKTGKRKINQYDLNNNYIFTYNSSADAARAVAPDKNINSVSSCILQVCKGKRKTAYGYKWKYFKVGL